MVYKEFFNYVKENGKLIGEWDSIAGIKKQYIINDYKVILDFDEKAPDDALIVSIFDKNEKRIWTSKYIIRTYRMLVHGYIDKEMNKEIEEQAREGLKQIFKKIKGDD